MSSFERWLLASADDDTQPHDTQAAWTRLSGRLSAVAATLPEPPPAPHPAPAALAARGAWSGALKWLLVGSVGGGAVTAGIMTARRAATPAPVERRVDSDRTPAPAEPTKPVPAPVGTDDQPTEPAKHHRRKPASRATGARGETPASTLAAEVSRLDAARAAIARGDYGDALRLVAAYHEAFPDGALVTDAEVVALEALSAQGDRAEVERRARSFLRQHPNDPHAARVRALAAQSLKGR